MLQNAREDAATGIRSCIPCQTRPCNYHACEANKTYLTANTWVNYNA